MNVAAICGEQKRKALYISRAEPEEKEIPANGKNNDDDETADAGNNNQDP